MNSINAGFQPYVARFSTVLGDDFRTDVEGRVMGIMTGDHDPYYLVEVVEPNGLRQLGLTASVKYLRPAHDFTAVGHNLPEGSRIRTITKCTMDMDGRDYAFLDVVFDNSHLTARLKTRDRDCAEMLNCLLERELQDTSDLVGLRVKVDVVDGKLDMSLA